MNSLIQDVRYALRQMLKSPGFAAIAVATLALGIGANTAIFSVVNGVLLRPLKFKDPHTLVRIWHVPPAASFPGITQFSVSPANYLDWKNQNHVFERMAIYGFRTFTLNNSGKPEQLSACAVSREFFDTLGVQPLLGRTLLPEENQPGRSNVVILSYKLWQGHFGSNLDLVGQNIVIDGENFLVAGVMPPSFRFPDFAELWTPMAWTGEDRAIRGNHNYMVIARLKPGTGLTAAQAEMNTISSRLQQLYPTDDKGWGAVVLPLHDDLVSDVRPAMLVLLGAVACVLLIACVNVANLVLAKTFSRQKEIAIRTALGASSRRIIRQVLTESVVLSLAGGLLGLTYASSGVRLIMAFLGDKLPGSFDVSVDGTVLAFTLGISLFTGILCGVLPGLRLARKNVSQTLKEGLGRTDVDSGKSRTRSILVVSEVALSLVLLIGAGLMIRSFQKLRTVNAGFDPHGVLKADVMVPRTKFSTGEGEVHFFDQVLQRARALPGVLSAGVADDIPLDDSGSHQPIAVDGRPVLPMSEQPEVDVRMITPGYMSSFRIPIIRGRDFGDTDVAGRPGAVLISESMAKQFWPGEDAIGKRLTLTFFPGISREVVGVVGDVKLDGLDQKRPAVALYMPLAQVTTSHHSGWNSFPMTLVVRTSTAPAGLASAVSNVVETVDPEIPVRDIVPMDDVVATSLSPERLNTLLLGVFAGLALLLAALGIYSVLSYSVRRRVGEIGIRLALGARITDVLRMVILEAMKPTLVGLGIGIAIAFAFGHLISSITYGVKPSDPLTFVLVSVLLVIVAFLASVIPAYRAARVDPMVALRYE